MKKTGIWLLVLGLVLSPALSPPAQADLAVLEVIKLAVKKVIKAVDLKIQRLQNQTLWLQNAQKVLENKLSQLRLQEIAEWTEKQRQLYQGYYQELWQVKHALATFGKVREIAQKQRALVEEYGRAVARLRQDPHFTAEEVGSMARVYAGMIEESAQQLDGLRLVVNAFTTQMSDGERLAIIDAVDRRIEGALSDLRQFNRQNLRLSLARAKDQNEIQTIRQLYGLPK